MLYNRLRIGRSKAAIRSFDVVKARGVKEIQISKDGSERGFTML